MVSTFSDALRLEMMATGDKAGSWSVTNNLNIGTLIEEAIVGYTTIPITDGAATTITLSDGISSEARHAVLELTGVLTAARVLEVPAKEKMYLIYNNTTGGFAVTVKVTGQTGISVPSGKKRFVYNTGVDVVDAITDLPANTTFNGDALLSEGTTEIDMVDGTFTGSVTTASLILGDGLVDTPAARFAAEPTSGWYRSANGQQSWSISGTARAHLNATGLTIVGAFTASGVGTFGSISTSSAGITSLAVGTLTVTGTSSLQATGVTGALTVSGTGAFGGNCTFGGTGAFTGAVTTPTLTVSSTFLTSGTGGITATYDIAVGRSLYVSGPTLSAPSATVTTSIVRGKNTLPSGSIILWGDASTSPPAAAGTWLRCDGSAVSRASYASLFAAIGTSNGGGDGFSTFNLPNIGNPSAPASAGGGTLVFIYYYIYNAS